MHKTKLLKVLRTFTADEFRQLRKYIASPIINTNPNLNRFYDLLRPHFPHFNSSKLDKSVVFKEVFPEHEYSDIKIRKLMSEMMRVVEKQLIHSELKEEAHATHRFLITAYGKRNLYPIFKKNTQALLQEIGSDYQHPIKNYHLLFNLQEKLFFHPDTQKHQLTDHLMESMMSNLDAFYALEKLRIGAEMRSRESVLNNKRYDIQLIEEVQQSFPPQNPLHRNPLYKAYQQVLKLQQSADQNVFAELKQTLLAINAAGPRSELQNILVHLINFSIRQINRGNLVFLKENFDLYRIGLDKGLLLENKRMTDTTFTNIVASGIRNEVFSWVEDFIDQYLHYLEDGIRLDVKTLCLGLMYYSQAKQSKAVELILNFGFNNDFYQLRAKTLLLRSIYELFLIDESYFRLLNAQSQAFEKFLRRNKTIGKQNIKGHLLFVQQLRQIANLRFWHKWAPRSRQRLETQIREAPNLVNKRWLLQQLSGSKN